MWLWWLKWLAAASKIMPVVETKLTLLRLFPRSITTQITLHRNHLSTFVRARISDTLYRPRSNASGCHDDVGTGVDVPVQAIIHDCVLVIPDSIKIGQPTASMSIWAGEQGHGHGPPCTNQKSLHGSESGTIDPSHATSRVGTLLRRICGDCESKRT